MIKKIACLGSEAFTLGFALAGIRIIIKPNEDVLDTIHDLKKREDVGIVIMQEEVLDGLGSQDRADIQDHVDPVFISISTHVESDNLRKLIIKSIGVDVWKEE